MRHDFAPLWCHPRSLCGVKWVSSRTLKMGTKRKCVGRRQTESPEDLIKGSVQPVPLGFWHKALGNTQAMLLGEKEVRRDVKFKTFAFQMWLLSCRGCCGSAVSSPNLGDWEL